MVKLDAGHPYGHDGPNPQSKDLNNIKNDFNIIHMETSKWTDELSDSDLGFIRSMILHSGSLKALALEYGVSYPTVRSRLDKIIEKIKVAESTTLDEFSQKIFAMAIDGQITRDAAKRIIELHHLQTGGKYGKH
ncbi:DUF2089 domain-containing protein [Paenarthrobacter nitroguajacolicus]|uniref:DUF2089 domain-containing protein n=2 Tax=Paenarthrobacter nitroguajacolicus TaxID=211146 RepID=A0A558H725_PAENT|nr:DUF2089 domain-containing protein [Paenarthrobacter nitroguajacolicus]